MKWYIKVLKNYANFSGRAQRKEYWMFLLLNTLIIFLVAFVDLLTGLIGILTTTYVVGVILPSLAVGIRRLHDTNRSGWWYLIGILPGIGPIILFVFFVEDSQEGTNRYGPNPKANPAPTA